MRKLALPGLAIAGAVLLAAPARTPAEQALDRQDRLALERLVQQAEEAAQKGPADPAAQYNLAAVSSTMAQLAMELGDKAAVRQVAQSGIQAARKALAAKPNSAEYHRILGTLCGQIIPADLLAALRYGRCALDSLNKAVQLDPNSPMVWLSRGVGNYYLPPAFGGGVDTAIKDLQKALELDPRLADGHLWLGIALRKAKRNEEARRAIAKSLELNPGRVWARQQLEKTPRQ